MFDRFSQSKIWQNYDTSADIKKKALRIAEIIPSEVRTILDVGCGNGIITNELSSRWDVTGLDNSAQALEFVKTKKVLASALSIPFEDKSFDLVISSEMLEHMNQVDLERAVNEIVRTAKKYILITVPNQENLQSSMVKCPNCSFVFHAWHHLQSFSKKKIENLFGSGLRLIHFETAGSCQQQWIPFLLKAKQLLGQWMNPGKETVCPDCGNNEFNKSHSNILIKIINFLNLLLSGHKPYWQILLFEKL